VERGVGCCVFGVFMSSTVFHPVEDLNICIDR